MKIVTVLGARPQFVKASILSRALEEFNNLNNEKISEIIIHTGQHYDHNMSQVFFNELSIPKPHINLNIGGGNHGFSTGQMLQQIESALLEIKPDLVLVYGDTNSTLAASLAASKLHIPIAHVEAGLRSFNKRMPEEINRILTDHISTYLFCPTEVSVGNLKSESILSGVYNVGDIMYDASLYYRDKARNDSFILDNLNLAPKTFSLVTCHRAENTDDPHRLSEILTGLWSLAKYNRIVFPLHPRTRKKINDFNLEHLLEGLTVTEPLPFLDMIRLEENAEKIITDSGGVQKEAYFFQVPCITLRDETEWVETVENNCNLLVGADSNLILDAFSQRFERSNYCEVYGDGQTAEKIISALLSAYL